MKNHERKRWHLYVLRLEQGKYYVGITSKTPEIRFGEHIRGYYAADWTRKYKPLEILLSKDLGMMTKEEAEATEHQKTKEFMRQRGWQNVRGGRFRSVEYKRFLGILWRTNTENDMPTIEMLYGIIASILLVVFAVYFLLSKYLA